MKKEKQMLLDDMQGQMKQSDSFIVVQYSELTGARSHELRKSLRGVGAYFEVMRKRMLVHAAKNIGVDLDVTQFPGHIGVVLGMQDSMEAAKAILAFSEENNNSLNLLAGHVEGQTVFADDLVKMASLPSKDVMRAELLGLLQAPAAGMLGTMQALLSSVVYCLDNRTKDNDL